MLVGLSCPVYFNGFWNDEKFVGTSTSHEHFHTFPIYTTRVLGWSGRDSQAVPNSVSRDESSQHDFSRIGSKEKLHESFKQCLGVKKDSCKFN